MTWVAVLIDDDLARHLDYLIRVGGYGSVSDLMCTAIRSYLASREDGKASTRLRTFLRDDLVKDRKLTAVR